MAVVQRCGLGEKRAELDVWKWSDLIFTVFHALRSWGLMNPLSLTSFLLLAAQLCCRVSLKALWADKQANDTSPGSKALL